MRFRKNLPAPEVQQVPASPTKPGSRLVGSVYLFLKSITDSVTGVLAGTYWGYKKGTFFEKSCILDL